MSAKLLGVMMMHRASQGAQGTSRLLPDRVAGRH